MLKGHHATQEIMHVSSADSKGTLPATNCPQRQQRNNNSGYANLINFNEDDQEYYNNYTQQQPTNPLDDIKARLVHLSGDNKVKLVEEMGVDEDFPTT